MHDSKQNSKQPICHKDHFSSKKCSFLKPPIHQLEQAHGFLVTCSKDQLKPIIYQMQINPTIGTAKIPVKINPSWYLKVELPRSPKELTKCTHVRDAENNKVFSLGRRLSILSFLWNRLKCQEEMNLVDIYSPKTAKLIGWIRILGLGDAGEAEKDKQFTVMDCESDTIFLLEFFYNENRLKAMQITNLEGTLIGICHPYNYNGTSSNYLSKYSDGKEEWRIQYTPVILDILPKSSKFVTLAAFLVGIAIR